MQNFSALSTEWATLPNTNTIWQNLTTINSTVTTDAVTDDNGNVLTPAIYWPQANGWQGSVNQNDLVVAGIITDAERIAAEVSAGLITQTFANSLTAGSV